MFKLTTAQLLLFSFFRQDGGGNIDYKAPHAYRPTPPRKHSPRVGRTKLFKGHRP